MILDKKKFKICVSSNGETLDSEIDSRFGRCEYFIIIDIDNYRISSVKSIKNISAQEERGAGISAAELIGKQGANLLITGDVGPKADEILKQLEIEVYKKSGNVRVAVSEYLEDDISKVDIKSSFINSSEEEKIVLKNQRIFIPLMEDKGELSEISLHFGHAPYFGLYNIDSEELIIKENKLDHGSINKTPVDQIIEQVNPTIVYAQDMGARAINLFTEKNIVLKTGPYKIAKEVIDNINNLDNLIKSCDH